MTTDVLETHLVAYLSLREALGFQMHAEKRILPAFVAYVNAQEPRRPIRAQMALEWACQASPHRGPSGAARRLSMARGFLRYLQASVPETEVPMPGLLPTPRRPTPFLFTPTQITALLEAAHASRPWGSLRPHLIHAARAAGQHRSANRRSDPLTDRACPPGSRSAAITHLGDEVP
jgi:integrase/recombinase XerD